jgi:hypothetical protein
MLYLRRLFFAPLSAVPTGMNLFQLLTKIALVAVIPSVLMAGVCDQTVVHAPINFGNSYDAYARAQVPTVESLLNKRWVLTGVGTRTGQSSLGSGYDRTGYEVDGKIPVLRFSNRAQTPQAPDWSDHPHFAWWEEGIGKTSELPEAAYQLNWPGAHELKRNSITFAFPLWGEARDLAPISGEGSRQRGQAYCRLESRGLLCMVERFAGEGANLHATGLSGFLIFQPY